MRRLSTQSNQTDPPPAASAFLDRGQVRPTANRRNFHFVLSRKAQSGMYLAGTPVALGRGPRSGLLFWVVGWRGGARMRRPSFRRFKTARGPQNPPGCPACSTQLPASGGARPGAGFFSYIT
jgi:hypothetical protein